MKIFDKDSLIKRSKKMDQFINYINKTPHKIYNTTISNVASDLECSVSTINRIITKMGFESYAKFKLYVSSFVVKNETPFFHDKKEHFGLCCIHKKTAQAIKSDFEKTFSRKILKELEDLSNKIYEAGMIKVLYNMKGTFLASLLRNELNALGVITVISKTEEDFNMISSNSDKDTNRLALVFSEKNLNKATGKQLASYNTSVLISKKNDINHEQFTNFIKIEHKESEYDKAFDASRYVFHIWIINNIVNWIKHKKKKGKHEK